MDSIAAISPIEGSDLLKSVQLTAMSVNAISEQMGLVLNKVNANTNRIIALEDRLSNHEHTETINRSQAKRIKRAVQARIRELLNLKYENGKLTDESLTIDVLYRPRFSNKCYSDSKYHSKMGESYTETLRVDFDEVLEYIGSWIPEGYSSAEEYMEYLDKRSEIRNKHGK